MFMSKCVGEIAGVLTVGKPGFPINSERASSAVYGIDQQFYIWPLRLSTARDLE
jgi:hypothetical protein